MDGVKRIKVPWAADRVAAAQGSTQANSMQNQGDSFSDGTDLITDAWWGALAARALHPVQVEIIEALRWIDQPLAATDFLQIFAAKHVGIRIEHHLRRLAKLGALTLESGGSARGPMGERSYRLRNQPSL